MIGYKINDVVSFEEIFPLYEAVGWTNYTSNLVMLQNALEHSLFILTARDEEGKLIGFLRAVGDGYSILYIQDIIVLPEYQRQGIGTQLLRQTLEYFNEVYQIILTTDSEVKTIAFTIAFYEANGFTAFSKYGCTSFMTNPLLQAK